jgi:hypothetical protein
MASSAARWKKTFPYRDGRVVVERLAREWRVKLAGEQAQSRTLVGAFELPLRHPAGASEMDVVLAALARDHAAGKQGSARGRLG